MSIALMTLAFKSTLPTTQKFVLVALCDSANDQGECYPSVPVLAEKCSLSERAVQTAVSVLEGFGYVRREFRKGRSTVYWINPTPAAAAPHPRTTCTPARRAPHPRSSCTGGCTRCTTTPAAPAPHPRSSCTHNRKGTVSRTVKGTVRETSTARRVGRGLG